MSVGPGCLQPPSCEGMSTKTQHSQLVFIWTSDRLALQALDIHPAQGLDRMDLISL